MSAPENMSFDQLLDEQISLFNQAISKMCRIDSKVLHPNKADYPIFRPANKEYFEYNYFEGLLEWYIRDYLITGVICRWLDKMGVDYSLPQRNINIIRFQYSNEQFGNDYPFALIIRTESESIGVRYSGICLNDEDFCSWLQELQVDHVEIIDWTDTDSLVSKKTELGVSPEQRNLVFYVTLHQFFNKFFPQTLYNIYVQKVRVAVAQANKEIGFQTIPRLSLRYLSDFKTSVLIELRNFPLRNCRYECFDQDGNPTGEYDNLLCDEDYDTIERNCFEDDLYSCLVGDENFAKCFLTSEYLYQIFKSGEQNQFDYTSVASGYFKSVELLLEKIMHLTLELPEHEKLFITSKQPPKGRNKDNGDFQRAGKYWHVRFKKEYEEIFSTEMGPLIRFVHDNNEGWHIRRGKETVNRCLTNYNQGCRNEHFHKHIICDFGTISAIRSNTILCLLYLLGACMPNNANMITDTSCEEYDRLYKALMDIPQSVKYFIINCDGQAEIKAVRLLDQDAPQYNDCGNIVSDIRFAKIHEFSIDDYAKFISSLSCDDCFVISRNNIPQEMFWYNTKKGKVQVVW